MARIKYDVKLLSEKARKKVSSIQLKEGDIYLGIKGSYMAVLHETKKSYITLNMSTGIVCTVYKLNRKRVKPTLNLVGILAKESLKLIK